MDAEQIRQLKPKLFQFLKLFDGCFPRRDTRAHLDVYVSGQLSDLPEKSCEPIALAAGVPPRNLQEFLAHYQWDEQQARQILQQLVMQEHGGLNAIGIFDETSDVKQGEKTPGVQRQWCGTLGKKQNCMVTVHLGFARNDFHCLLDGDLFLPEGWAADRERCREAGIPDDVEYRPKWQIALDLFDRATSHGVRFDWLTFDEGYGGKPEFLRQLQARQQIFVAEIPRCFTGWITPPRLTDRPYQRRGGGQRRRRPRLAANSRHAISVENMLKYVPALRDQSWIRYHVKDGEKGPQIWEAKQADIQMKDEHDLPGLPLQLVVARNALDHEEIKYFVSNASAETSVSTLLLVAFSRWRVERCFEDQKQEVGLDQWEGRRWLGLQRHLILTSISYLFLAREQERLGKKKSGADDLSAPPRGQFIDSQLVAQRSSVPGPACRRRRDDATLAAA